MFGIARLKHDAEVHLGFNNTIESMRYIAAQKEIEAIDDKLSKTRMAPRFTQQLESAKKVCRNMMEEAISGIVILDTTIN